MATASAPQSSPEQIGNLTSTARVLVVGLGWAAFMLGVLAFWMRSKYEGRAMIVTNVFLVASVIALALAVWQAFTLWFKNETSAEKATTLANQRRLFSLILMAGGLGLIGLAFFLGIDKKPGGNYSFSPDNLGEAVGALLFGVIALGGGFLLSQPASDHPTSPVQFLNEKVPVLKMAMAVLSAAALISIGYLYYINRTEEKYLNVLPELVALLSASILFLACFLWLNSGNLDEFGVRLFVLILGGSVGLILFLYSLLRIYYWRNDFLGGLSAWQGPNAWHNWTCVYLQVVALALMFVSFNLARTDIRSNVYLRRVMYGYDAVVQSLLLLEILAVVNMVFYIMVPFTFDWTASRGAYALSPATQNLVSKLNKEVNVFVLMSKNSSSFRDVRNMMENCSALSNKFKVKYLSPETEPGEYNRLAEIFPKIRPEGAEGGGHKGILIVSGPMPSLGEKHNSLNAFIPENKLTEESRPRSRDDKPKRIFKGEGEFMREFKFLVQDQKKRKIYFLQGDDLPSINDSKFTQRPLVQFDFAKLGLGLLVEKLRADNYEVKGVSFDEAPPELKGPDSRNKDVVFVQDEGAEKKKSIPKDCDTLVVAGVGKQLSAATIDAIDRYMMERGGTMLLCLDVVTDAKYSKMNDTGLEPLLKRFGVEVTNNFPIALRQPVSQFDDPSTLIATSASESDHVLARQFVRKGIEVKNTARALKATQMPGQFKAEPVMQYLESGTSMFTLLESDVTQLRKNLLVYLFEMDKKRLIPSKIARPEIVPFAIAVTDTAGDRPRLVVTGDSEFITNVELLPRAAETSLTNFSFAASTLEWMAQRESIGTLPKETSVFRIDPSVESARMVLLPGWLMLLAMTGLGTGIWITRRR